MRLLGSVPVLNCSDMERSLNFYQQALQFVVLKQRAGEQGPDWVYLQSGDTLLMLEQAPADPENKMRSVSRLYFYTDDVATMHHYLNAKGYEVSGIMQTDYMKEFDLHDPDGQRLTVGQRLDQSEQG